jgi:hypothetical protein
VLSCTVNFPRDLSVSRSECVILGHGYQLFWQRRVRGDHLSFEEETQHIQVNVARRFSFH